METMEPDLRQATDAALVAAVAAADEAAMAELHRRHGPAVYGLALRVIGDQAIAEEVFQDVFVRLWQAPARFDPTRGELRAFLLREARSRGIDRVRANESRQRREERSEREGAANAGADIEREVWELIRSEKVREALAELPVVERRAITMAYFEGHTYREVAKLLDEPEGTIKSRIRLGLKRLADALDRAGIGVRS
jgi:RNA polymerase sigma-70 factor, ECF subfamily